MKAVGYKKALPIHDINALIDIELQQPIATGHDILVKINAISVNPVDYKIRENVSPSHDEYKVIGWDAVGEVVSIGDKVTRFSAGDIVYYAGDLNRSGCNAQFQLVDECLVGLKPKSLSDPEAAALPLTGITAWELLFEHLQLGKQSLASKERSAEVLLIVGAAGGVGSILIQLAKAMTGATIIASASRKCSQAWVEKLGADHIIDHTKPLQPQVQALNIGPITHVASLNSTDTYFDAYVDLLVPFGRIAMIDDPESINIMKMKPKSLSFHIEFMFARSMFNAADKCKQGVLLNDLAKLIDQGHIQTTISKNLGVINAENLKVAHTVLESGRSMGKIVLEGF